MPSEIIEEQGVVRSLTDGVAKVEITQPSCEKDEECTTCKCGGDGRKILQVKTDFDLREGQEVTVRIKRPPLLPAVFFVFILPSLCLLAGIGVGRAVFGPWGAVLGVILCAGSFAVMVLYDRHLRVTNKAEVRILPQGLEP